MKRIILVVLLILTLAIPALAEAAQSFSPYDYVTGSAGGGRFLYYDFPDISLYIPASWEGRFKVEPDEFGVAFYHTASYEKFQEEGFGDGGCCVVVSRRCYGIASLLRLASDALYCASHWQYITAEVIICRSTHAASNLSISAHCRIRMSA